ncbi:MAG: DUF1801 domain-containing protein [Chloroflexi bacterium]|nr:DUF1801 domain-containing protein [Chloroflexota bacterium]
MSTLKTKPTKANVNAFINKISAAEKREDCLELVKIMKQATKSEPKMWGASIVGFGSYHYRYATGREGDWMLTGFSPRKQNLTIYIMSGFERQAELLKRLGKFTTGSSCLYLKRLGDVDKKILKELIRESVKIMKHRR